MTEFFNNHIGGASELTVLANLIPGEVPGRFPITYSARLRQHLRLLGALRRTGLEGRRAGVYTGPIDTLRTLQFVRWTLIDNDTRMLLSVNFDRPLQPYIRRIVDVAGPLLDTILCHCEDFTWRSSDQGFDNFLSFAVDHSVPVELFAAAHPNNSVDDADYFLQMDEKQRVDNLRGPEVDALARPDPLRDLIKRQSRDKIEHRFVSPLMQLALNVDEWPLAVLDQGLNILNALYENSHLFPKTGLLDPNSRDDLLYYNLAEKLTPGFWTSIYGLAARAMKGRDNLPFKVKDPLALTDPEVRALNGFIDGLIAKVGPNLPDNLALLNRFQETRDWFGNPPEQRPKAKAQKITQPKDFKEDVQTGLLESKPADTGCLLMLRVDDADGGRAFLKAMDKLLWPKPAQDVSWNLSITHDGLKSLRVSETLRLQFPSVFREGMAARAGLLGDVDVNNPREWEWPINNWQGKNQPVIPESIDLIVQVAAYTGTPTHVFDDNHPLIGEIGKLADLAAMHDVRLLAVEPMQRNYIDKENRVGIMGHIGFTDAISQPQLGKAPEYKVANVDRRNNLEDDTSLLGDLLLGRASKLDLDYNLSSAIRQKPDHLDPFREYADSTFKDGTFQVIRKIEIDTAAFDAVDKEVFQGGDVSVDIIKENMVGRHPDGTPLGGTKPSDNTFNYDEGNPARGRPVDEASLAHEIPLQSHVRRSNPREADSARIVRRGFSYGPFGDNPTEKRGMMFIAYNANIAEQFEVIQRWISGGNGTGITSGHGDPLLAPRRPEGRRSFQFIHNGEPVRVGLPNQPMSVLKWGIYAFVPSREGLKSLVQGGHPHKEERPAPVLSDTRRMTKRDIHRLEQFSLDDWKLLLEDTDEERRADREAVWAAIRDTKGGVLRTKYGVLVAKGPGVRQVLKNDDNAFSVREYWKRKSTTIGVTHLGKDADPVDAEFENADKDAVALNKAFNAAVKKGDYKKEADQVNWFLAPRKGQDYFADALEVAKEWIAEQPEDTRYLPGGITSSEGQRVVCDRYIYDVVARLCARWFGMPIDAGIDLGGPEKPDTPHCPMDLVRSSFYVFWPHPTEHVKEASEDRTAKLLKHFTAYVKGAKISEEPTLLNELLGTSDDREWIAKAVIGACYGFAGPTSGSCRSVLYDWIDTSQLWRMQQRLRESGTTSSAGVFSLMQDSVVASMAKRAAPDLIHRAVVQDTKIGNVDVKAGEKVVVSLKSAAEEDPGNAKEYLFGGEYGSKEVPLHACPGQQMGLSVIMACLAALMMDYDIRPEGPLSLRLKPVD